MKNWKLVANVLYDYLVKEDKIPPDNDDYRPEEYEDQQCQDWIGIIETITKPMNIPTKVYELVKEYPGREIGETADFRPWVCSTHFLWTRDEEPIPKEFQPDISTWFRVVNVQNS